MMIYQSEPPEFVCENCMTVSQEYLMDYHVGFENQAPQNPILYDHFPIYLMAIYTVYFGVDPIFHIQIISSWLYIPFKSHL